MKTTLLYLLCLVSLSASELVISNGTAEDAVVTIFTATGDRYVVVPKINSIQLRVETPITHMYAVSADTGMEGTFNFDPDEPSTGDVYLIFFAAGPETLSGLLTNHPTGHAQPIPDAMIWQPFVAGLGMWVLPLLIRLAMRVMRRGLEMGALT